MPSGAETAGKATTDDGAATSAIDDAIKALVKTQFSAPEAKRWVTTILEKNPTLERTAPPIVGAVLRARPAPHCA